MREMRDSGVEWIGEIPKDWNCCKQKYRFTLINGRAFKDNEFEEDGTYRILRVGNLFSNPVWYSSSLELEPDKYCEKGDLIYAWSMSYGGEKINIDDKVLLEYYKLEKDFEGLIELESTEGGYTPISGDSGHREPKKDTLTVIIDKINEKYGTHFTEMDKVLVQMENDYANQEKWQSYAKNNDRATFMLLFEKDFPNMAADRYEQNDQFFRKLFDDPDMMRQVMETVGSVLYERLKKKYIFDPKSGVIEEATPETYVEDTYLTKK